MWCGFLFSASKPELVGAAIQKVWGESARAEQATYQEAKTTFQNHMKCHKNTTLTALEAWITSEMKTPSIRANLTDASHRGRILYFENQFSVTKLFQIFWYLGGIFNFEQSEPIGKWYCKHIFANLAVETATYVLANKAFNAYLTNRVAVDPSRNPVNQCDHVRDLTVKNNLFRQQR